MARKLLIQLACEGQVAFTNNSAYTMVESAGLTCPFWNRESKSCLLAEEMDIKSRGIPSSFQNKGMGLVTKLNPYETKCITAFKTVWANILYHGRLSIFIQWNGRIRYATWRFSSATDSTKIGFTPFPAWSQALAAGRRSQA